MATASVTYLFSANTLIQSSQANKNFDDLVVFFNNQVIHKDASIAFTNVPSGPATDATADNQFMRNAFLARGVHSSSGTGAAFHQGTITFGKTFSVAPIVLATVRITSGIDLIVQWTAAPTTTTVNYEVATTNGLGFNTAYHLYWLAVPVEP